MNKLNRYQIRANETGDVIDDFETLEEAEKMADRYVEEDVKDGNYTKKFYEIYDVAKEEQVETF